ncbi:MAG: hypothetical protein JWP89_3318 [Schlesneria sp.]|nr:hypothetical protein [Schlesneria sp.]
MIRPLLLATVFATGVVINNSLVHAQYLSERLVPPQQVSLPPVPMVVQPTEPRLLGAERPRSHLWALPFGVFPGTPTALETEKRPANWQRPALDVPVLSSETDPRRPFFPLQPTASRAYSPSSNPAQLPTLARFPQPSEPLPLAADNPTSTAAFEVLTAAVALATPNSIPLLRLSIPDPFEQIRTIRFSVAAADIDEPTLMMDRPPLAKLPIVEPPK